MRTVFEVLAWVVTVAVVVTLWGCGDMGDMTVEVYYTDTENDVDVEVERETNIEAEAEVEIERNVETDVEVDVEVETETEAEAEVDMEIEIDEPVPLLAPEAEPELTAEVCDGVDNDNDGEVDNVNGVGMCVVMNGAVPTEGEWACVPNPSFDGLLQVGCLEVCRWREVIGDYVDNDCDGEVDEAE